MTRQREAVPLAAPPVQTNRRACPYCEARYGFGETVLGWQIHHGPDGHTFECQADPRWAEQRAQQERAALVAVHKAAAALLADVRTYYPVGEFPCEGLLLTLDTACASYQRIHSAIGLVEPRE